MDTDFGEGRAASSGSFRIIALDEPLSETFRDSYWERVKELLRDVFQVDAAEADAARQTLKDILGEQARQAQTLFYHADPFEVAADLAGMRGQETTSEQRSRYYNLPQWIERKAVSDV